VSSQQVQISVDVKEAYIRGYTDINFFASIALPEVCTAPLPYFYISVFQILVNRKPEDTGKLLRFALGLPRGHAKTTFLKIIIAWLIVYDKISFALVVCVEGSLAEAIISDISEMLGSPQMEQIYGTWTDHLAVNSKEEKQISYHQRHIVLKARGVLAGIRGINVHHRRPDIILMDDVQSLENDESPTDAAKLLKIIVGTIMKAIETKGDRLIIYLGNMYSENCILRQLQHNPGWTSLITGAILENGEPLWQELWPLEALMESFQHDEALQLADLWFAEVMNDPKAKATSLLTETLPECPYNIEDPSFIPDGVFITIDPAGFRDVSDDNQIVVHYVHDGKGIIAESRGGIFKPDELIKEAISLALFHGASLIAVEDTGYQQTLGFWLTHYIQELNISGIHIVPVHHHGRSKEQRIRQFVAECLAGNYFHGTAAARSAFIWQATKYKLGAKKNKDDLLDATAYGLDVRNEYWHLVTNLRSSGIKLVTATVQDNNTPF